ncbi:hypothetical protein HanIR_Chr15g0754081 [Helianthus annuus]|nr:hypothetical protein HanIR_Chr15g0754081 [Helianthus annuus]
MGFLMVQLSWVPRFSSLKPAQFQEARNLMESLSRLVRQMKMKEPLMKQPLNERVRLMRKFVLKEG